MRPGVGSLANLLFIFKDEKIDLKLRKEDECLVIVERTHRQTNTTEVPFIRLVVNYFVTYSFFLSTS